MAGTLRRMGENLKSLKGGKPLFMRGKKGVDEVFEKAREKSRSQPKKVLDRTDKMQRRGQ